MSIFGPQRAPKGTRAYLKGIVRRYIIYALNTIERLRRRWIYQRRRNTLPRLVAQGDSWFCYPLPQPIDTLQHLSRSYAINVLAGGARRTGAMVTPHQLTHFKRAIERQSPAGVLLTGGGVDLLDIMNARAVRTPYTGTAFTPETPDFLNHKDIEPILKNIEENLIILAQTALKAGVAKVFLIGYDYLHVWPKSGQTIRDSLDMAGIAPNHHKKTVKALMDLLFAAHQRVAEKTPGLTYIRVYGMAGPRSKWPDEAHAHSQGYAQIADHIHGILARSL